jgi:hypothetical protein
MDKIIFYSHLVDNQFEFQAKNIYADRITSQFCPFCKSECCSSTLKQTCSNLLWHERRVFDKTNVVRILQLVTVSASLYDVQEVESCLVWSWWGMTVIQISRTTTHGQLKFTEPELLKIDLKSSPRPCFSSLASTWKINNTVNNLFSSVS